MGKCPSIFNYVFILFIHYFSWTKNAPVTVQYGKGLTAIHIAAALGNNDAIRALVECGADFFV
jgi:hypothetical protein